MPIVHRWLKRSERTILGNIQKTGYYLARTDSPVPFAVRKLKTIGSDRHADFRRFLDRNGNHVIFDVGANNGSSALDFIDHFPRARVWSFEPTPSAFAKLSTNAADYGTITAVHTAVGDRVGTTILYMNRSDQTNSLLANAADGDRFVAAGLMDPIGTTEVPITTVDEVAAKQKLGRIDLLKIDAQGSELIILRGAGKSIHEGRIPLIYLEVSFVRYYDAQPLFQDVYGHLVGEGYQLVGLYGTCSTQQYMLSSDALFVRTDALRGAT